MKNKLFQIIDSISLSVFNFLVTFITLKQVGQEGVVVYGLSMTITLVLLSFYRCIFLIPLNNNIVEGVNINSLRSIVNWTILALVPSSLLFIVVFDAWNFSIFLLLAPYYLSHESLKYLSPSLEVNWSANLSSFVAVIAILLLSYFDRFSFNALSVLLFTCLLIDLAIFFRFCNKVSISKISCAFFSDNQQIFYRLSQSISQMFVVHAPFLAAPLFFSTALVSSLFIARSIYQPVQIVIKSIEQIDQRSMNNHMVKSKVWLAKMSAKYSFVSLFLGLICLLLGGALLTLYYSPEVLPPNDTLYVWLVIFICLSVCRTQEIRLVKLDRLTSVNKSYFLGGGIQVMFLILLLILDGELPMQPSVMILLSWMTVLLFLIISNIKYKDERFNEI
ncbi:hypothetical protein [Vibrio sinaloensis]|uniref:hypothetical protein n=2 Tax=Photobacterium sp. (strain ATCC 43367) TaxID=379097 RepID=UPI002F4295E7